MTAKASINDSSCEGKSGIPPIPPFFHATLASSTNRKSGAYNTLPVRSSSFRKAIAAGVPASGKNHFATTEQSTTASDTIGNLASRELSVLSLPSLNLSVRDQNETRQCAPIPVDDSWKLSTPPALARGAMSLLAEWIAGPSWPVLLSVRTSHLVYFVSELISFCLLSNSIFTSFQIQFQALEEGAIPQPLGSPTKCWN